MEEISRAVGNAGASTKAAAEMRREYTAQALKSSLKPGVVHVLQLRQIYGSITPTNTGYLLLVRE
ncbi:MAG: hypothetical protein AAFY76_02150 [Cyanobacteria bacterium J06649_11]